MGLKDTLREEHGGMMKMLVVLQKFSAKFMDLEDEEARELEALIEFFEIYVDRIHHGKEERHLFPALSLARISNIDSLVRSLIDDHSQAREHMQQLRSHAADMRSPEAGDCNGFGVAVQRYVELVRKHIRKENSELLPLIEDRLSEVERLQISRQFQDLEEAGLGSSLPETFLARVRTLNEKYLPRQI